ncbi:fimbrial protein, partial [Morganella morganii]
MVHLRGGLVEAGCTLSTNNENDVIDMGEFRTNQFKGTGSYSDNIPFKLVITNCSTAVSSKVGLSVFGYINEKDPQIIKLEDSDETAKGVGVAILDNDGGIIIPDNIPSKWINFHEGENVLHFNARYRATDMQVTGGKANASV